MTAKGRRAGPLGDENVRPLTVVVDAQLGTRNTHLTARSKSLSFVLCEFSLNSNTDIQDPKLLLDLGSPSLPRLRPVFSVVTRQGESACPHAFSHHATCPALGPSAKRETFSHRSRGVGTGAALRALGAGFRSWREALPPERKGGEGPGEVCEGTSDGAVARDDTIFVR